MIDVTNKTCTGCRACEQKCPNQCIDIKSDSEGFLVPRVNLDECINCGLCERVCHLNKEIKADISPKVYALKFKGDGVLLKSASGGAFPALSLPVLKNGGVVFGAAYDDSLFVRHVFIESLDDLYLLQSSKYVQSDTQKTYTKVREFLESGRAVLYSGTPCQIAGLKSFLGRDYDNLITADIICHGVPSPESFRKYIVWLETKFGQKVLEYDFRSKERQDWGLTYKIKTKTKTKFGNCGVDPYYSNFLNGSNYRECCYICRYADSKRVSDFTIGDFWGIERFHPEFFSKKGVSVMMVNTKKGEAFFEKVKPFITYIESDLKKAAAENKNLCSPTERPDKRNTVYNGLYTMSDEEYVVRMLMPAVTFKARLKNIIPSRLKKAVKKVLNKKDR